MLYLTKYEWRWALIFTMLSVLWMAVEFEFGLHDDISEYFSYFYILFVLAALCYGLFFYDKKVNRYKGRIKREHAVTSGFSLTVLISVLSIPVQFFIHLFVFPDLIPNIKEYMIKSSGMNETFAQMFNVLNTLWFYPLVFFIMGVLYTFIFTKFFRRSLNRTVGTKHTRRRSN